MTNKLVVLAAEDGADSEVLYTNLSEVSILDYILDRLPSQSDLTTLVRRLCAEVGYKPPPRSTTIQRVEGLLTFCGRSLEFVQGVVATLQELEAERRRKRTHAKHNNSGGIGEDGEQEASGDEKSREDDCDRPEDLSDDEDGGSDPSDGEDNAKADNENAGGIASDGSRHESAVKPAPSGQGTSDGPARVVQPMPPLPHHLNDPAPGCRLSARPPTNLSSPAWVLTLPQGRAYNLQGSLSRSWAPDSVGKGETSGGHKGNVLGYKAFLTESEARRQCVSWSWSWFALSDADKDRQWNEYQLSRGRMVESSSATSSSSSGVASTSDGTEVGPASAAMQDLPAATTTTVGEGLSSSSAKGVRACSSQDAKPPTKRQKTRT